jgi:hypothetical protein
MTGRLALLAGCALIAMSGVARADCAAELAALEEGAVQAAGGEVAKDGSLAPLQESEAAAGNAAAPTAGDAEGADEAASTAEDTGDGEVAKDGSLAPLEGEAGGASESVAMSPQDVEAQQEGGPTAMEAADQGDAAATEVYADREAALDAARQALADGDEEACMEAVEAAKVL